MKLRQLFEEVHNVIIQEAIDYDQMFEKPYRLAMNAADGFPNLEMWIQDVFQDLRASEISRIKFYFDRSDVKLYMTRLLKIALILKLVNKIFDEIGVDSLERLKALRQEHTKQINFFDNDRNLSGFDMQNFWIFMQENVRHFLSLPIPEIQNFRFERQNPYDILRHFEELEDEWKEKGGDQLVSYNDEPVVMDFGDGFAWYDLETASCGIEGKSMRHCGNSPMEGDPDHTIYSLREEHEDGMLRPVATFIVNKQTRLLGEMKGRFNEKPQEKYHRYIIDLLMSDHISGVKGGGYLPENNFSIKDVSGWESYVEQKPSLLTLPEYIEEFGVDDYVRSIVDVTGDGFINGETVTIETDLRAVADLPTSFLRAEGEEEMRERMLEDHPVLNSSIRVDDLLGTLSASQQNQIEDLFNDEDDVSEWKTAEEILEQSDDQGTNLFPELQMVYRDHMLISLEQQFDEAFQDFVKNPSYIELEIESDESSIRMITIEMEEEGMLGVNGIHIFKDANFDDDWRVEINVDFGRFIQYLVNNGFEDLDMSIDIKSANYGPFYRNVDFDPDIDYYELQQEYQTVIDQFK